MVAFEKAQARFNYRVAGVAIHNGRVLLDRNTRNNYWVLPGGHPDMMESMAVALRREMFEEIGANVEIIRLLWIIENFFYKDKPVHELSFYFLMEIDPDSPLLLSEGPFYGEEHGYQLVYQWQPIEENALMKLPLFPGFLTTGLLELPDNPTHIVFDDARDMPPRIGKKAKRPQTGQLPQVNLFGKSDGVPVGSDKKFNKA